MRREWRHAAWWAVLIVTATSVPLPGGGVLERPFLLDGFLQADKLVHLGLYGVFGWLVVRALDAGGAARWTGLAGALTLVLAFAALDEWHQAWIPSRSPQVVDWMADAVGILVGGTARRIRSAPDGGGGSGRDDAGSDASRRHSATGRSRE